MQMSNIDSNEFDDIFVKQSNLFIETFPNVFKQ